MGTFADLAEAYRYPAPHRLERLRGMPAAATPPTAEPLGSFLDAIAPMSLGEWEELHTRTLDLAPLFAPYIGHAAWGEDYRRGAFMAALNRAQSEAGISNDGELPDHLIPVLRYLDAVDRPLPELVEALGPALARMRRDLTGAEPTNPYLHLLEATIVAAGSLTAAGGR
jgi:nitrate reductase molybdenum cofactor assembly chaperone NarJ/NarW